MNTQDTRQVLYNATLPELTALMRAWNQPAFRARQLYRQLYVRLASAPESMTDLPLALRERLAAETRMGSLELVRLQRADDGLTRKALFALPDGSVVETVLMIYPDRATVCVSTQAGCAMGCVFCATGKLGLLRNLSSGEIVEQVLWAARELQATASTIATVSSLTNLVFMGMGESFANYERWWAAVERLHDPQGFNMGARNMTVSTVGLVPGIRRLAQEQLPINLAISLHAPDDELRSALMPVNRRYPIATLLAATRDYISQTNRRVSFEYVLLQGRNDSPQQARMLAEQLWASATGTGPLLYHINLIPWNPVPGTPLGRSERKRVLDFQQVLQEQNIPCTVRVERGVEIDAACGQLAGGDALPAGMRERDTESRTIPLQTQR
ncbi:MAG: 23S rRNA (adenine(2503)-C(2))-methyltransferase RlmN [Chloroflexaceae bacterium]